MTFCTRKHIRLDLHVVFLLAPASLPLPLWLRACVLMMDWLRSYFEKLFHSFTLLLLSHSIRVFCFVFEGKSNHSDIWKIKGQKCASMWEREYKANIGVCKKCTRETRYFSLSPSNQIELHIHHTVCVCLCEHKRRRRWWRKESRRGEKERVRVKVERNRHTHQNINFI